MRESRLMEWSSVAALIIVILMILIPSGLLVKESKAVRALETQGFSEITITDRAWFMVSMRGGDKSDCVRFTATATNPAGKRVRVYVFSGWLFKGATIRTP